MAHESVLIVGAGPIGIAAAIAARRRGLDPLLIDAGPIANSIARYPVGMVFFTTPERLEVGDHPLVCLGAKPTREEALKYYRGIVRAEGLRVEPYTRLVGIERPNGGLECAMVSSRGAERTRLTMTADRVVLATGYFEHPNLMGIPGESLPHVFHYMDEAHFSTGLDVVVVGGKNSAIEMALSTYRAGARVTLIHRGVSLKPSVKYWLRPDIENRIKTGEIAARPESSVVRIDPRTITIARRGTEEKIAADRVYLLTGYHPDFDLFRSIGIRLEASTGRPEFDPETLETNVPGVYLAGSVTSGRFISEIFIENGKYDGERIFGDVHDRREALARAARIDRPLGE